jgi:hypothetical protein
VTASRVLVVALLLGVVCRGAQYAAGTSLFHDEAFVALNVRHVPLAALRGPLDWHEPSPPGFLLLEKLAVAAGGESELALRAAPLVAGILALLAFARLATSVCLSASGAALAVLLLAASDKLIADACLVKHFSLDLLAAVCLVGVAWRAVRTAAPAALWWWGLLAALAPWVSYASAFVVAGSAMVLAPAAWRRGASSRRALLAALVLVSLSALALAGAVQAQRSDTVVGFWSRAFPPFDGGVVAVGIWLGRSMVGLFDYLWRPLGGLLLIPAALAASPYHAQRRPLLALLWLPVALALLASALRWWPFGGNQHMAFAAPAVLLLAADGLVLGGRRLAVGQRALALLAGTVVLAPALACALYHLAVPRQRHELRPVIASVQAQRRDGDQLAVFDPATFEFYTGIDVRTAPPPDLAAAARVWVITPRSSHGALDPDVARVVDHLLATRPRLATFETHGAAAYLFGPPDTVP